MNKFTYVLLMTLVIVGCSSPTKDLTGQFDLDRDSLMYRMKDTGEIITEDFFFTEYDSLAQSVVRKERFVADNGKLISGIDCIGKDVIRKSDYSKMPKLLISKISSKAPEGKELCDEYHVPVILLERHFYDDEVVDFYKKARGIILAETHYNKGGEVLKYYSYRDGVKIIPISDFFEVMSLTTGYNLGYDYKAYPVVIIKLKNISGKPISEVIELRYQFIDNDEIKDSGTSYIQTSLDPNWGNGMIKSDEIRCSVGYERALNSDTDIKLILTYRDESTLFSGIVKKDLID